MNRFRFSRIWRNQSGFSLTDLVASLPLSVLIFVILILAITSFMRTFEETKLFLQLQDELFNAVETIRYGVAKKSVNEDEGLIGLSTARKASISPNRQSIDIWPVIVKQGLGEDSYKASFWLASDGSLRASARYGIKMLSDYQVFPSGDARINNRAQFRITSLEFIPEKYNGDTLILVGIRVKAEVRYRAREPEQTQEEDLKKNVRQIEYKTSVFLNNAGSTN